MPIYVYECVKNGHQFEVEQRMTDEPLTKCEVCGGKVERLLFAPAIHFKGSGFHNTDYGTKKRPKDAGDASSTTSSDSAGSTSSDSGSTSKTTEATPAARAKRGVGP